MIRDDIGAQRAAQRWEFLVIAVPAAAIAFAAMWFAYQFVEPAPPRTVTMSTGSAKGAFHLAGQRYAEILARSGVTLELKTSKGSKENAALLMDASSGVKVALVQGGAVTEKEAPELRSLGRVYQQPLWIFYRGDVAKDRFSQLKGQRLNLGPVGSGTRVLVTDMLAATNITADDAVFSAFENDVAADKLIAGELDAVFLATGAESPVIKQLLAAKGVRLMSLANAEAYTRLKPHLGKVVLPAGMIDLAANIPDGDVVLVASQASLLVREDLHPAIVGLLVNAAREVHSAGGMFQRVGEYPKPSDPEIPMSDDALRVYSTGVTFLQRHLPFWVATFLERIAIMILPVATILLPLSRFAPWLYRWRIRRRIQYWYGQLKRLEARLAAGAAGNDDELAVEIRRIDDAVNSIPVPLAYTDRLYTLKAAIELVRQRIAARA